MPSPSLKSVPWTVSPYPCLRASNAASLSSTVTSKPSLCSASAAAAPPMPPPETTIVPQDAFFLASFDGPASFVKRALAGSADGSKPPRPPSIPRFAPLARSRRAALTRFRTFPGLPALENAHSRLSNSSSLNEAEDASFAALEASASRIAETRVPSARNKSLCAFDRTAPASANVHAVAAISLALEPTHARAAARAKASETDANETRFGSWPPGSSAFASASSASAPRIAHVSVVMFAAVNASASARASTVARMDANSAPAPRAASLAYAQAAFTRSCSLNRSSDGSPRAAQARSASNNASSGKHALANAQAALAISRGGIDIGSFCLMNDGFSVTVVIASPPLRLAHLVSARATPRKSAPRVASSPPFALACAQATFASARASKASRAHIAADAFASAANRAAS